MRIATARCGRLGAECRGSLRPDSVSRGRSGEGGGRGKTWTGQARKRRHGLISIIHLLFFLWLKKITSTKKQHLLDEELKLKPQVKS